MMSPGGIGRLLRTLRTEAGRTRAEQARWLEEFGGRYVDPENIKRWETERRLPIPDWFEQLSAGYGIPVEEIRRAVAATRRARRLAAASELLGQQEEPSVERRDFLGLSVLTAGFAAEPWGRLAAAVSGPRVDAALAGELVAATGELFVTEHHMPARLLAQRLGAHLEVLTSLIPHAGAHRAELTAAAGETAALAGWACYDLGRARDAGRYYETAALAGREAGQPSVVALAMGYASYGAEPDQARQMLAAAQEHVRGPGYATARSWLAAREAEEAAATGDREGAVRALDRAATAFDYADPAGEQPWIAFFGASRLDSLTVSTYARLRHPDLEAAAGLALEHLGEDDSKVAIAVLSDVACGYVLAGDVDRGVEAGRRFLVAATATPTTMGRERMARLVELLPAGHGAARSLAADLHTALAA